MSPREFQHLLPEPGPVGVARTARALQGVLSGSGAGLSLLSDPSLRKVAPHPEAALLLQTSGTTGDPMGVQLSADALLASARSGALALGSAGCWLTALPVSSVAGLLTVARSVLAGATPLPWPGVGGVEPFTAQSFSDAAADMLHRCQIDGLPAYCSLVPTQLARLLRGGRPALEPLARFDAVLIGGSALAPRMRAAALEAGVHLVETYGATETCGGVVYDGVPLPGVTAAILPDGANATDGGAGDPGGAGGAGGTIVLGGPTIALGYLGRPDLDAVRFVDGAFHAPDHGIWSDGALIVQGRTDEIVKIGGVKVSLAAVTDQVRRQPGVLDALTVAHPHPEWDATTHVYVIADGGASADLEERLTAAIAERFGTAAAPQQVERVTELPQAGSGKPMLGTH